MNKLKIAHTILYTKNWYKRSDSLIEDLKLMLELDGYQPSNVHDISKILLKSIKNLESKGYQTNIEKILEMINPNQTWKMGYNHALAGVDNNTDPYCHNTAIVYACCSILRFITNDEWEVKCPMPKYVKESFEYENLYNCILKNYNHTKS